MKTALFFSNPFGFGPTGKMIAVLEEFKKHWDGQIVYASSGLCKEIMHMTDIIQEDVDQRDEASIESVIKKYENVYVVSSLNRFAIAVAHRLGIPNTFVDGLAWMWDTIPEEFLLSDIYICTKFPGLEEKLKAYPSARMVPFILSPLPERTNSDGSMIVHFGGGENPLQDQICEEYYALFGEALESLDHSGEIIVTGGKKCLDVVEKYVSRSSITFKTLPKDVFLQKLAQCSHFFTTSGLNATMEAFAMGVPTSFLLPSNLSQWKLLLALQEAGAADNALMWNTYFPEYKLRDGITERENIKEIHGLARDMYGNNDLKAQFKDDFAKVLQAIPDVAGQHAFSQLMGTGGAEKTVEILREKWNF